MLRTLGTGGALVLGSGVAAAGHEEPHPPHIDSHYGYSAPTDEQLPGKLAPDETVGLHIAEEGPFTFHFDPMGLQIDAGDVVRFDFHSPDHNVAPFHVGHGRQQRVPDDEVPFSSPMISPGGFWLFEFDHPGTYDLYCAPHQVFGMVMRLVVGDPAAADYDGDFGDEGRPPTSAEDLAQFPGVDEWQLPTSADAFATDALSVANIVEKGPVTRSDVIADL
ncbi:cupredoxin domain-containing protein [Halomicrobium salinisoli]|uniref:cupredoxin domain-containing protein n=1 Tax=Halomicrobium salinisoli TaxID=2878391 RepID=UPI001CEFC505|nr:plastocyanin/azurin family copper-binding protein [Halomicrobium salinisoli]